MIAGLAERIAIGIEADVAPEVLDFAAHLAASAETRAILFYGSNLRTGSLDGVLDFYVLLPGEPERGLWPRVSYHEMAHGDRVLRAKVATMSLGKFAQAARGELLDTTIWARFVQPCAKVWTRDAASASAVIEALAAAAVTAGRLAAALGPASGDEAAYWAALFRATYTAEFRVEKPGRESAILEGGGVHFEGLLPLAWQSGGIGFASQAGELSPRLASNERVSIERWWQRRRRTGKWLNLARLLKAATTFQGATRYAAWKIERHTGMAVAITPWRERHPLLAAPGVLLALWRYRRAAARKAPLQG